MTEEVSKVEVISPVPIPVIITGKSTNAESHTQDQVLDPSRPAKTTFQEDLTTASQRKVNLIWEYTQAAIALLVVASTMVAGLYTMIKGSEVIPTILSVAFGTVIGFYFSRTNHAAIGGIGIKPESQYVGR